MATYVIGQRVWIYNVNARAGTEPDAGTVVKVGRTLVTVRHDAATYLESQYRMDDGSWNNRDYSHHSWIRTDEQRAAEERRTAAIAALRESGLRLDPAKREIPTAQLEAVVRVLTEEPVSCS